jgi:acyl dehydratase
LEPLPIPAHRLLNGGFRMDVHGPLPVGEALEVEAQVTRIDEDARKIRITQRITTGTATSPGAMTIEFYPVVPKRGGSETPEGARAEAHDERLRPVVPEVGVETFGSWKLGPRAGLDFALLTGDFNPIHWLAPAARMSGFRNVILHGFASFGRVFEHWVTERLAGNPQRVVSVAARFNKPLVLPTTATAWTDGNGSVWLGSKQGEKSWLSAHFTCKD